MRRATMVTATAMVTALALGAGAISAGEARADAAEFFKCALKEDGTIAALVGVANDFEAITAENGLANFSVAFLTPLYSSDLSEGSFYWVGVADTLSGAARANEIWNSEASAEIRNRWDGQVSECESSSLHTLTRTPNEGDED